MTKKDDLVTGAFKDLFIGAKKKKHKKKKRKKRSLIRTAKNIVSTKLF